MFSQCASCARKIGEPILPGGVAALLILGIFKLGYLQPLEILSYHLLFYLRGSIPWNSQIIIIEVEQERDEHLGQSFQNRDYYTQLLNTLTIADAKVIVLDVPLVTPQPEDQFLAEAIKRHGKVILTRSWDGSGNALMPSPLLQSVAAGIGHIAQQEQYGIVRNLQLHIDGVPALALVAAQTYLTGLPALAALPSLEQVLWLNWLSPSQQAIRYTAADIIQQRIPLQTFVDKLVLVGLSTPLNSTQTPFNHNVPTSSLYVQATAIDNLLSHTYLRRLDEQWLILFVCLSGPGLSWWLTGRRAPQQVWLCLGLCCGWAILSLLLFYQNYWMPTTPVILLCVLTGVGTILIELRRLRLQLQLSEERYELAIQSSNEGFWDWNLKTDRIYLSPRWKEMLGYRDEEIDDRPCNWFDRVHPTDLIQLQAAIETHVQGQVPQFEQEHRMLHRDGSYRWVLTRGIAVYRQAGQPYRLAGSQTDITERRNTEERLQKNALYDELTGLPNRTFFLDCLRQAIAHTHEQPLFTYAVLLVDLDRFQVVNSSLGNTIGDQLLIATAYRLKAFLPAEGVLAHLSGDEFAILLKHIENLGEATRIADQIQRLLALPFNLNGHEVFNTVSIGIVMNDTQYSQPEHLLRDADTAMYQAKHLGKARYQIFNKTVQLRLLARMQLENDLRRAIAKEQGYAAESEDTQELQLYYQPIVQLTTEKLIGFEALVRWQHPELGFLSPGKFIPMAEETGLIIPLGWWIIRQACRQMRDWQMQSGDQLPLNISVNLASEQFSLPDLTEQIYNILQDIGLEAARLKLELTEGTIMENAKSVVATLHSLRALGIQLAIDDFGTGYSSLSYLCRFPINTIKIDRSFVSRMCIDSDNAEIVRTIITLAQNLRINTTAEGVETGEQLVQLVNMGCEYGQGNFFGKPLSSEAATELVTRQLVG